MNKQRNETNEDLCVQGYQFTLTDRSRDATVPGNYHKSMQITACL